MLTPANHRPRHRFKLHRAKMMRIVMNPGCGWECDVNPQPTLDDLNTSIFRARERNLRVLHLAGHGKKTCGFIWNRDDAATASRQASTIANPATHQKVTCQVDKQKMEQYLRACGFVKRSGRRELSPASGESV